MKNCPQSPWLHAHDISERDNYTFYLKISLLMFSYNAEKFSLLIFIFIFFLNPDISTC